MLYKMYKLFYILVKGQWGVKAAQAENENHYVDTPNPNQKLHKIPL